MLCLDIVIKCKNCSGAPILHCAGFIWIDLKGVCHFVLFLLVTSFLQSATIGDNEI